MGVQVGCLDMCRKGRGLCVGVDGGRGACIVTGEGASCRDADIRLWRALLVRPVPCVLTRAGIAFKTAKRLLHSAKAWLVRRRRMRVEGRKDQS